MRNLQLTRDARFAAALINTIGLAKCPAFLGQINVASRQLDRPKRA